eukprot:COSAG01_NODE_1270_length_10961_cov_34.289423_13_plen_80_part_00
MKKATSVKKVVCKKKKKKKKEGEWGHRPGALVDTVPQRSSSGLEHVGCAGWGRAIDVGIRVIDVGIRGALCHSVFHAYE